MSVLPVPSFPEPGYLHHLQKLLPVGKPVLLPPAHPGFCSHPDFHRLPVQAEHSFPVRRKSPVPSALPPDLLPHPKPFPNALVLTHFPPPAPDALSKVPVDFPPPPEKLPVPLSASVSVVPLPAHFLKPCPKLLPVPAPQPVPQVPRPSAA